MKKLITLIFITALLAGCSKPASKEELAIKAYAQTLSKDTKMDLDFKLIELKDMGEVKAQDSLTYFRARYKKGNLIAFADTIKSRLDQRNKIIADAESKGSMRRSTKEYIEKLKADIPEITTGLKLLEKYLTDSTRVLYKKIQCHYTIKNPMLNNAQQEITRVYRYDAGKDIVIGTEE
jgi:hypothetical protein